MNIKKSQRTFATVTLVTVASISIVLVAYAALLGTLNSTGYVNVGGISGIVYYSTTNTETPSAWQNELGTPNPLATSDPWYAKIETTSGGYVGLATIKWELKKSADGGVNWSAAVGETVSFDYSLNGNVQIIYATSNGIFAEPGNHDWHSNTGYGTGLWKVEVTISSKA